ILFDRNESLTQQLGPNLWVECEIIAELEKCFIARPLRIINDQQEEELSELSIENLPPPKPTKLPTPTVVIKPQENTVTKNYLEPWHQPDKPEEKQSPTPKTFILTHLISFDTTVSYSPKSGGNLHIPMSLTHRFNRYIHDRVRVTIETYEEA